MRGVPQLDLRQCGRSRQETGHTLATDHNHDEDEDNEDDDDNDEDEVIIMMMISDHNGSDGYFVGYHNNCKRCDKDHKNCKRCLVSLFTAMSL